MKTSNGTLKAVLTVILSSMVSMSVYAGIQTNTENLGGSQFVKYSYLVTFKEPAEGSLPLVEPPDQEIIDKAGEQIPFGEHSTGQSKQEIAEKIDLNGEVIAIFDTINAIHVKMDAEEAYRLSLDERVLLVEQDMTLTTATVIPNNPANVTDSHPTFQDGILLLPSVDSPERGGEYQNVKFKLTTEGEWQLLDFVIPKELQQIDKVEVIKTDSFPIQVFLRVVGNFTSGCQEMGQINYQLLGKKFEVWMYSNVGEKFSSGEFSCTQGFVPFTHIIPLPIYSLNKGEYEYSVNGRYTGTFNLAKDNKL